MNRRARTILLLTDGRPGHQALSEGIVRALATRGNIDIVRVKIRRGRWPGRVAAWMVRLLPPAVALQTIYGLGRHDVPASDAIVSAGAETLAASAALARLRSVPNIHYGSLRQFVPDDFALVLTSYAGRIASPRQVFWPKPAGFDPDEIGPPSQPAQWPDGRPATVLLAVGGEAGDCRFAEPDYAALVRLIETGKQSGVTWFVSNSRRTPDRLSEQLWGLARPGGPIARFADVRRPDAPRLATLLGPADALIVTADSSSMVSEGIFARRPVLAVAPQDCPLTADEVAYRETLAEHGWLATRPLAGLTFDAACRALSQLKPETANPLESLAALLCDRIPELAD